MENLPFSASFFPLYAIVIKIFFLLHRSAHKLIEQSKVQEPTIASAYKAAGVAMEIISRTLLENCGADIIRKQTQLRAKHARGENLTWGIDGEKGELADMNSLGVWEPLTVKMQTVR